jgi:hypothetical protein
MGKSSEPAAPPPPDYQKQADLDLRNQQKMLEAQTVANRTNSVGPQGTNTWSKDPVTGAWTNTVDAGDAGKNYQAQQAGLLGMTNAGSAALPGAISSALRGLNTSGLPDWQTIGAPTQQVDANGLASQAGQFNMDPTGNSKAIQDATYALLSPQRQMARDGEIQRLKNQGLTEDSPAFQRAMLTLGQGDTDAQLKSLLAGQQEYGNSFNRGLSSNNQNYNQNLQAQNLAMGLRGQQFDQNAATVNQSNALRNSQLNEQSLLNNYDLNQVKGLMGLTTGGGGGTGLPQIGNGNTPQQGVADASGGMAALNNTYKAQMDAYNANQAQNANSNKSAGGLLGAGAGFFLGGPAGMGIGSSLGGMLGGLF